MRKICKISKKKFKLTTLGFTLVELLAVLVILAVILVIAVPKVMDIIKATRISTLESTAKLVALSAEKKKVENEIIGNNEVLTCENVVKINDIDYENCYIEFINNKAVVTIIGKGTFKGMNACEATKTNANITERCLNKKVEVTLELNGGIAKDISGIYKEGTIIDLEEPIKENSTFTSYKIVSGNSKLENNKLTVGSTNTIVHAYWEKLTILNVILNGGKLKQQLNSSYMTGTNIVLEQPQKTGYTFTNWDVIEGDSFLSGSNFTIGNVDTSILANYIPNNYTIEYDLDGGEFDGNFPTTASYDSIVQINKPQKLGYKFIGWTISGLDKENARYGTSSTNISQVINDIALGEYFLNLNSNVNGKVLMKANWEFVPNSIVYEHKGEYVFDGTNYINTGIPLYSEEYIDMNFEVSFTILNIDNEQEKYATLFNSVTEIDENFPGVAFRFSNSTEYFEVIGNNKINNYASRLVKLDLTKVTNVKISRINNITYYSINDGDYYQLQDYSVFSEYFNIPVTFGASIDENGEPFRYFKGTLSNMQIKFLSKNENINAYLLKHYTKESTSFDGTNYINTNVYLFDKNNINKDFKISFTIDSLNKEQEEYSTILNSLNEANKDYFGMLFRYTKSTSGASTQFQFISNGMTKKSTLFDIDGIKNVVFLRKNNKLFYSFNNEDMQEIMDYSDFTEYFSIPVTIGASIDEAGEPYRYFRGSISEIEIMIKENIN